MTNPTNRTWSSTIAINQVSAALETMQVAHQRRKKFEVTDFDGYKGGLTVPIFIPKSLEFPAGLIIDVRNQDIKGSINEKFPLFYLRAKYVFPSPVLFIIDGECFARQGSRPYISREWLKNMGLEDPESNIAGVLWLYEFNQWLRNAKVSSAAPGSR